MAQIPHADSSRVRPLRKLRICVHDLLINPHLHHAVFAGPRTDSPCCFHWRQRIARRRRFWSGSIPTTIQVSANGTAERKATSIRVAFPLPRWTATGACVAYFPVARRPSFSARGSASTTNVRGLLRIHSRYGPRIRSRAVRSLSSRGFVAADYSAATLGSYRVEPTTSSAELSSRWTPAPFVAHCRVSLTDDGAVHPVRDDFRYVELRERRPVRLLPFPGLG